MRSVVGLFSPLVFPLIGIIGCRPASTTPDRTPPIALSYDTSTVQSAAPTVEPSGDPKMRDAGPPALDTTVLISAIGDCVLGGDDDGTQASTPFALELAAHPNDPDWFFSGTRDTLAADDITLANLEGTLTTADEPAPDHVFHFRGKPSYAEMLARGSVEVVNIANNHSEDFGPKGLSGTLRALRSASVAAAGNELVVTRVVHGIEVKILGFMGGGPAFKKYVTSKIEKHKTPDNLVVVSLHWGNEGTHRVTAIQREVGRLAVDAGADLVIGTHPHVIQGIETYRGRHIVYSLGNFIFGGNVNPVDKDAIIYQERFGKAQGSLVTVDSKVIPVRVSSTPKRNDFRPIPLEGEDRDRVLAQVAQWSDELN